MADVTQQAKDRLGDLEASVEGLSDLLAEKVARIEELERKLKVETRAHGITSDALFSARARIEELERAERFSGQKIREIQNELQAAQEATHEPGWSELNGINRRLTQELQAAQAERDRAVKANQGLQQARGSKRVPCRNDHASKGEDGEHEPASYCAGCLYDKSAQLQAAQEEREGCDSELFRLLVLVGGWGMEVERLRGALRELSIWSLARWEPDDPQTESEEMRLYALRALTPEGTQDD